MNPTTTPSPTGTTLLDAVCRRGVLVSTSVRYWRGCKRLNPEDLGLDPSNVSERLIQLGHKRLIALLKTVKKQCRVWDRAEITLEANPDSAGDWRALRRLRRAGFNRLSLGVQSTNDELLRRIGRYFWGPIPWIWWSSS